MELLRNGKAINGALRLAMTEAVGTFDRTCCRYKAVHISSRGES